MDWLQFTAAVIGHIAWPAVIIALLVVLRKQVGALAERIEEFSFGGAKFIWKKTLAEGREIADQLPEHSPDLKSSYEATDQRSDQKDEPALASVQSKTGLSNPGSFAKRSNRARWSRSKKSLFHLTAIGAILSAYDDVESILQEIGELIEVYGPQARSVVYVLKTEGYITEDIADLFEKVSVGRSLVAHEDARPSDRDVADYVEQAKALESVLVTLRNRLQASKNQSS